MRYRFTFIVLCLLTTFILHANGKDAVFNERGIALRGYDVVAFFTEKKAIKGNESYSYHFHGSKWKFTSKENKELFKTNPLKYLPQYNGYCAYGIGKGGYLAPIDPHAFTIRNNKLYLNYSFKVGKRWNAKQDAYIQKGDEI